MRPARYSGPRQGDLVLRPCHAVAIAVVVIVCFTSIAPCGEDSPIALRRVFIGGDRIPQEIERQQEMALVPRPQFEASVRKAEYVMKSNRLPVRLAEARYRAVLRDGHLTGTAVWKINN